MIEQRFEFDGRSLTQLVRVFAVSRPLSPKRRYDETEVPGRDGVLVSVDGFEAYEVEVDVMLMASTAFEVEDVRRRLSEALTGCVTGRLVLPASCGISHEAMFVGGVELARIEQYPTCKLKFLVTDPVGRGRSRKAALQTSAATVEVAGTAETWPVITATPRAQGHWTVFNVTTGAFVRVEAAFGGGQKVVVDMEAMRCTVDGADHAVSIDSDFFPLAPGRNVLKVSSGTASMAWEERWL